MNTVLPVLARCLLAAVALPAAAAAEPPARPNILFLLADDLSWEGVHAASGLDIDTPHLDRLAGRGASFTHAYNPGAWHGAVCVASRTMLNTGLQLWAARRAVPELDALAAGQRLWPQRLANAGYTTCFAGKWHVATDVKKLFGHVRHVRPGMPRTVPQAYHRPVEGQPDAWHPADPAHGGYWQHGRHWSEVAADDFAEMLEVVKGQPAPWFMYIAFNAPHDPRQAPQEFLDRYPLERVAIPDDYLPLYPHRQAIGAGPGLRDEQLAPFPRTPFAVKTHRREYFALISHLDAQVGRILDALEQSGEAGETVVAFTSDHGLACGHHGLLGKQNMYEPSVRVPLLLAGPGIPHVAVDAPVYLQDIMPTTLELAGAGAGDGVEFASLLPLAHGRGAPRPAVFGAYMDLQRMVAADQRKLVLYPKARVARLFDLAADPHEKDDLMGKPGGPEAARPLFATLLGLQRRHGDALDLAAVYPELAP